MQDYPRLRFKKDPKRAPTGVRKGHSAKTLTARQKAYDESGLSPARGYRRPGSYKK